MFTAGGNAIGGNAVTAYGRVALIIAILGPVFLAFTIFGVRETRNYNDDPVPPVSFKKIITTITGNDQLLWIALIFLLQQIGNGIVMAGVGQTYIYVEYGYEGGFFTLFQMLGMVVTAFLMIFYPAISRKTPRKKLMHLLMIISVIGYAVMLVPSLVMQTGAMKVAGFDVKFLLLTLGYMAANFGQYGFYLIMMISIINTVEYNEYNHGNRAEAIISSLRPFLTKMGSAICVALTSATYLIFKVTSITNEISSIERDAAKQIITDAQKGSQIDGLLSNSVQSTQSTGLLLAMTLVPLAFMLGAFFLYKAKYKLDEPEYDRICSELELRRSSVK